MKDGYYWARFKGTIEGDDPIVVRIIGSDVLVAGTDAYYEIDEFDFVTREPLTPPETTPR